jgi:transcriptional regulator with XRE-family HTH domain
MYYPGMSTNEAYALPLTLGRQIAEARKRVGLNQTQLGRRWSEHRNTISRWENDGGEPSFSQIVDLSNLSGWPLELFARAARGSAPSPGDGGSVIGVSGSACTRSPQVTYLFPRGVDSVRATDKVA